MDTKKNVDLSTMGRLKKMLKLKNRLHRNDFKTSSVSWDENRKKPELPESPTKSFKDDFCLSPPLMAVWGLQQGGLPTLGTTS